MSRHVCKQRGTNLEPLNTNVTSLSTSNDQVAELVICTWRGFCVGKSNLISKLVFHLPRRAYRYSQHDRLFVSIGF